MHSIVADALYICGNGVCVALKLCHGREIHNALLNVIDKRAAHYTVARITLFHSDTCHFISTCKDALTDVGGPLTDSYRGQCTAS